MTVSSQLCLLAQVTLEARFLFDLQGFLILRNVLSNEEVSRYRTALEKLEEPARKEKKSTVRLDGLQLLSPAFDPLLDHPGILPYLKEFMGEPNIGATWSISKFQGAEPVVWHLGTHYREYSFVPSPIPYEDDPATPPYKGFPHGVIRTKMLNVIIMLTDNGPDDGCACLLPGSHKTNFDFDWRLFKPGLEQTGSIAATGKAGDVCLFSECLFHGGLAKTTPGTRSNLYFNFVHAHFNVVALAGPGAANLWLPPEVRARMTPEQRALTSWMETVNLDYLKR